MPDYIQATAGPGGGMFPEPVLIYDVYNRQGSTLSYGKVAQLDFAGSSTELDAADADTFDPGNSTGSVWATVIAPTNTSQVSGIHLICDEVDGIADNAKGRLMLKGMHPSAYVIKATGTTTPGDVLGVDNNGNLTADSGTGDKVYARSLDVSDADLTTAEQKKVYFDGTGATTPGVF